MHQSLLWVKQTHRREFNLLGNILLLNWVERNKDGKHKIRKTPFLPLSQPELHSNIFSLIAFVGPFCEATVEQKFGLSAALCSSLFCACLLLTCLLSSGVRPPGAMVLLRCSASGVTLDS